MLPAFDDHIDILWIEFQPVAHAPGHLGGDERCSAAQERIVDEFAPLRVIQNRFAHQFDGFLRRMIELVFVRAAHDELRRGRVPDGRVLTGLAVPGSVFLSNVPNRLVTKPIMRASEYGTALVPDDLLVMLEADPQQTIQNLTSELTCVPYVRRLETRYERKRLRPVGTRIAADSGLRVAGWPGPLRVPRPS